MGALDDLEMPRHVHYPVSVEEWDRGVRRSRIVRSPDECAAALADGGSLTPIIIGQDVPGVPPAESADEAPDSPAPPPSAEPKRRGWPKGKPRKVA